MQISANAPIAPGNDAADLKSPKKTTAAQEPKAYKVTLSTYARAKQLKAQGASNPVIAAELGLDVKTVDSYFDTTVAATALTPYHPKSPATGAIQTSSAKRGVETQTNK